MPAEIVNGVSIHYEDSGEEDLVPVVFSHGLLFSGRMFEAQVAALRGRYRVVTYDHRGQGRSSHDPGWSPHAIETLYRDAIVFLERRDLRPCHWVGLSMGGFIGMRLAARRPDLVMSLALLNTSAEAERPEQVTQYGRLAWAALALSPARLVDRIMPILFGRTFMADPARAEERARWRAELSANSRLVFRAVQGVIQREAVLAELARIECPTLVIAGEEDVPTPPPKARRIHEAIPGSTMVRVPAGHSSTIEQPALIAQLLGDFLDGVKRTLAAR